MTLIVHESDVPIEDRRDIEPCFHVFNNMSNWNWFNGTGLADVQLWIHEQPFTVIMYKGWWHSFFFDHPDSFLLTKLVYSNYNWRPHWKQPEPFMDFYRRWKAIDDEIQDAYKVKIRKERIARGEINE